MFTVVVNNDNNVYFTLAEQSNRYGWIGHCCKITYELKNEKK